MMGFSSQVIVGRRPTRYTGVSVANMIAFSTFSTFFCFSAIFCTCADADQSWMISLHFPRRTMPAVYALICFLSLSVKSLMFPFSFWLISAMKGVAIMSSLVHSLTVVFSGLFLILNLLVEGWYWLGHLELTSILFLPSTLFHFYSLLFEAHVKRLLAWSTSFSVNLAHVVLPWAPRFSLLYGLTHGLSKSFLFSSSQGQKNITWSFLSGLLGGFPLSLVWKVKTFLIFDKASLFLQWSLLAYFIVFIKLCFKENFSVKKVLFWNRFGKSWFTSAVLLSLVFL